MRARAKTEDRRRRGLSDASITSLAKRSDRRRGKGGGVFLSLESSARAKGRRLPSPIETSRQSHTFQSGGERIVDENRRPPPKKRNTERRALKPKSNRRDDDDRRSHLFLFLFLSRSKGASSSFVRSRRARVTIDTRDSSRPKMMMKSPSSSSSSQGKKGESIKVTTL